MVEDGLARGEDLSSHETTQAIELSQLLLRVAEISEAGHPVVREMHHPNPSPNPEPAPAPAPESEPEPEPEPSPNANQVREMHALHQNVQMYLAGARGGAAGGGGGGGGAADGPGLGLGSGERPSGQAVPAHIRKMGKRYDVLREELKRLARAADTPPPCEP